MKRTLSIISALTLSLLIAAAGPLSQTVRLVRVDPTAAEYSVVFSAWTELPQQSTKQPQPNDKSQTPKPVQTIEALSGYWDTASACQAPIADADVPPQPPTAPARPAVVPTPFCALLPVAEAPPSFIPSSRGPPQA